MNRQTAIVGHNIGYLFADGISRFDALEFEFRFGTHGLIESKASSRLAQILAGVLAPSSGAVKRTVERCLFLPSAPIGEEVADELGVRGKVDALRAIQRGSTETLYFDALEEDWNFEGRLHEAMRAVGAHLYSLSDSMTEISPAELEHLRMARIYAEAPDLVVLEEPTENLLNFALEWQKANACSRCLIVVTQDAAALGKMEWIWEFGDLGLRSFGGGYAGYREARRVEIQRADENLLAAERELERFRERDREARAKQWSRIERGRQFSDTGMPKVHRGNKKRKSQETLARVRQLHEGRIEEAEERVKKALLELESKRETLFADSET